MSEPTKDGVAASERESEAIAETMELTKAALAAAAYTDLEARLLRFVDAVSPFVRDVLDEPFPWKVGGQVTTWMTVDEYDEALAALGALRD